MLEPHVSEALRRSDVRIVVTGANGWLGRATSHVLLECLGEEFPSRVRCFGSQHRSIPLANGVAVEQRPLVELGELAPAPTFLLHFAFLTKDIAEAMEESEYRAANQQISSTVRDALGRIGCKGVFLASSGAAHFADDEKASPAMRAYGELKRDDAVVLVHLRELGPDVVVADGLVGVVIGVDRAGRVNDYRTPGGEAGSTDPQSAETCAVKADRVRGAA